MEIINKNFGREIKYRCGGPCKKLFKRNSGIEQEVIIITGEPIGRGYVRWGNLCNKCIQKIIKCMTS